MHARGSGIRMLGSAHQSKGFTLIEALVALTLLALVLLGLLAGLLTVYQHNLRNLLRDEAGSVAQECVENLRSIPFASLTSLDIPCNGPATVAVSSPCLNPAGVNVVSRQVRNVSTTFRVGWAIVDRGANLKEVDVRVCWNYRGQEYVYTFRTFVGK